MHLVVVQQDRRDVLCHLEIHDLIFLEWLMYDQCGEVGCLINFHTYCSESLNYTYLRFDTHLTVLVATPSIQLTIRHQC